MNKKQQCDFCLKYEKTAQQRVEHGVKTASLYCDDCFQPEVYYYTAHDQQLLIPEAIDKAFKLEGRENICAELKSNG
jgi:hypothetical protein